jgi:hypothetical protein
MKICTQRSEELYLESMQWYTHGAGTTGEKCPVNHHVPKGPVLLSIQVSLVQQEKFEGKTPNVGTIWSIAKFFSKLS